MENFAEFYKKFITQIDPHYFGGDSSTRLYQAAMTRVNELMDAKADTTEGEELDRLTDRAIQYEASEEDAHKLANTAPLSSLIRGLIDSVVELKNLVSQPRRLARIEVPPGGALLLKVDDDTFREAMQDPDSNKLFELMNIWQDQIGAPIIVLPICWNLISIDATAAAATQRKPPERIIKL